MLPEIGHIGPFVIRTYTLLLDLAILIGLAVLAWEGWRLDDEPAEWVDAGLSALVGGIVFGRLLHVAIHWPYFSEYTSEIVQLWRGGLDWHGAIIGGLATLAIFSALRGLHYRQITDTLSLILPLGTILVYTACLASGCGYGRELASLSDAPRFLLIEAPDLYGILAPRLASQLYGIALGLIMLGLSAILTLSLHRIGVRFWLILAVLGLGTFGIGFTLGDTMPMLGPLRLDQTLDLLMAALGLGGAWLAARPRPRIYTFRGAPDASGR